ncbi:MAG TPA: substrate-binding domain-containing protein [Burkholderiaceae bacterium]|jgi:ribose transport system substrate-binding protein
MKFITKKSITLLALLFSMIGATYGAEDDPALFLGKANARVAHATAFKNTWDGPSTGPKLAQNKLIVFIGADLAGDSSQQKLANVVKDVGANVGWSVQFMDCYGVQSRRAESFSRAIALKPSAIILAGADAKSEAKSIAAAAEKKIPVIGWHAALANGPADGLFTNIGTDPKEAGQLAALLSVVDSKAKAGVVILSDASSVNLATKSLGMIETIKQCQTCSLLQVEQVASNEKPEQIVQRLATLDKQFGPKLTYVLATNDRMFDGLSGTAAANAFGGEIKFQTVSAGFGSTNAYTRIHSKKIQLGTVAEPLTMQAWQLIDEANRAMAGDKPSGYAPEPYIVTIQNIAYHGGQNNTFDPINGYQEAYKKIWGR